MRRIVPLAAAILAGAIGWLWIASPDRRTLPEDRDAAGPTPAVPGAPLSGRPPETPPPPGPADPEPPRVPEPDRPGATSTPGMGPWPVSPESAARIRAGCRMSAHGKPDPAAYGEALPVRLRLENRSEEELAVPGFSGRQFAAGAFGVEALFEGVEPVPLSLALAVTRRKVETLSLRPGETCETEIDLRWLLEFHRPGMYVVAVKFDTEGLSGGSAHAVPADAAVRIRILPPTEEEVLARAARIDAAAPWSGSDWQEIGRLGAMGSRHAYPALDRILGLADAAIRERPHGPTDRVRTRSLVALAREEIALLEHFRCEEWSEVRKYLDEPAEALEGRRRLQDLGRAVLELHGH